MIRVFNKFEPIPHGYVEVDTTSRGSFKDLSPFFLGPVSNECNVLENLWQYSKVYPQHNAGTQPNMDYYRWRNEGWASTRANRYPMGKGAKPCYSWWNGQRLDYITARRVIYIPHYTYLVIRTQSYAQLYKWVSQGRDIALRDFDGYDHVSQNMTLQDVINNPKRSMGHAFLIYGLLTGELNNEYGESS